MYCVLHIFVHSWHQNESFDVSKIFTVSRYPYVKTNVGTLS